jgi:hypothetical protein
LQSQSYLIKELLVKKAYAMENSVANDLSEAGKDLYEKKMYKEAAAIFEIATLTKNLRTICLIFLFRKLFVF